MTLRSDTPSRTPDGPASTAGRPAGRATSHGRPVFNWHQSHGDGLTRGERAADRLRNWMGSWWFVGGFLVFMVIWAIVNMATFAWDPYPYILLNLFLSMLAGLQGAILLISARRQDAIAAALASHDFETDTAAKVEIEELTAINQAQLVELRELHQALVLLARAVPAAPGRQG